MKLHFLYLFFFLGIPLLSLAQEITDSLQVTLDPIEVTAIRSTISPADAPLSLATYQRDLQTVNHEGGLSLSSLSQNLPGLWVNNRQNYALGDRMTIRGIGWRAQFGVRGIQVVLNDMPLTVADGQTMFNIVDPAFIRDIELIRGPAATYWGNSSGGVLYLSTTPEYAQPGSSVRLRTLGGSYGMRKAEAEYSYSSSRHTMTAYSSYLQTNGFRNYSAATVARTGVTGSLRLTSKSQLKYQAAGIWMPKAQHPSALTQQMARETPTAAVASFVEAEAGKQIAQGQSGLSYLLETPAGFLTLSGYGIYRDLNNPLPFGIITVNRWTGGFRATLDKSLSNVNLQVGSEVKYQNDDRTEFENVNHGNRGTIQVDQVEKVWNRALFATGTFSYNRFNVMGGIRYDRLQFKAGAPNAQLSGERTFDSFSPSIGLSYQPGHQTLFLNLSTSFEAPTTTELVNRPGAGNGFNPTLEPEQTTGLEAGIRGTLFDEAVQYDLTAFRLWIRDLLFPYQLEANGPTFYRNQGATRHSGIESKLSWNINRNWSLSATADLIIAEFKEGTADGISLAGNDVPGVPDHRISSRLSWSPGSFLTSLSYQHVSSYTADNLNTSENEAYGVIDVKWSYQGHLGKDNLEVQPFLHINNVMDVRYNSSVVVNAFGGRYFEPAPGRNIRLGVSVHF